MKPTNKDAARYLELEAMIEHLEQERTHLRYLFLSNRRTKLRDFLIQIERYEQERMAGVKAAQKKGHYAQIKRWGLINEVTVTTLKIVPKARRRI